jgi:CRISPR-associated protein Cas5d
VEPKDQALLVWGELACFSEIKAERFSYPIITPSAARGIYDAIYCKPRQFRWQITCIEVLRPPGDDRATEPKYIALRRNEVSKKAPAPSTIWKWIEGRERPQPILADDTEHEVRVQRQTMALKNVRYCLHAYIRPWPGYEDQLQAFEAQFRRRAERGQCIYQPYLGCREFPAYFELLPPNAKLDTERMPWTADLGWMLYDVFNLSQPGSPHSEWYITLFYAKVQNGVLKVPEYESNEVRKP